MKNFLVILLLILSLHCFSQTGIYDINTKEDILIPNPRTGVLKLATNQFNDTLDVAIWNDRISINEYKKRLKSDTITFNLAGMKIDTYLLTVYYKKIRIFRKYISIEP